MFMNHVGGEHVYDTLLSLDMFGVCLVNTLGRLPMLNCFVFLFFLTNLFEFLETETGLMLKSRMMFLVWFFKQVERNEDRRKKGRKN